MSKVFVFIKGDERFEEVENLIKSQLNVKKIEFQSPASKGTEFVVELDAKLTPELEAEGYAREMSRQVQAFRKKLGLNKKDRIELYINTDDELKNILESKKEFIKERTNSKKVDFVIPLKETFKNRIDFKIKDKRGEMGIIY